MTDTEKSDNTRWSKGMVQACHTSGKVPSHVNSTVPRFRSTFSDMAFLPNVLPAC